MKNSFYMLLLLLACAKLSSAQETDKIVTLVVSGQGKTPDEAKQNALRSAIEQAFGTFVSSNTEILNDNLVKDEIVSVANGNIQNFEVISELEIPNLGYNTTLKATVSVTKLTSFVTSKGFEADFKGSLFAFNVNQQIFNEKNEVKAINDMSTVIKSLADIAFDYSIKPSEPIAVNSSNDQWKIPLEISVFGNNNLITLADYMHKTLKGLSLSTDEANNYIKLGKKVYPVSFAVNNKNFSYLILRSEKSASDLIKLLYYFNHSILNFKVSNGVETFTLEDHRENLYYIYDANFRFFSGTTTSRGDRINYNASVFYPKVGSSFSKVGIEDAGLIVKPQYSGQKFLASESHRKDYYVVLNYKSWYKNQFINEIENFYNDHYVEFYLYSTNNTEYDRDRYLINQFAFVKKLKNVISNNKIGLIISFVNLVPGNELVRFDYNDLRTIDEMQKIKNYKIISQ